MKYVRMALAGLALAGAALSVPAVANAGTVRLEGPRQVTQFVAYAESRSVLVTPVHLTKGETIRLGLDGESFRVATESFNGGGTVFTVAPVLPVADVHKTLLFTP